MNAIVTYDLSKQYSNTVALCGLTLQIPQGSAFACVGSEDSGKTTLIRLLAGLCRPTMGECSIMGLSPVFEAEKLHAVVGTVLDTARLYENMTVSANLRFFAGVNGVDSNDALDRISFLLHKLDIWESRDRRIDDLPTGVSRRVSLARALIHTPQVLLMDEPPEGMDKETADSIQELVDYLSAEEGTTILLCTRDMDLAQRLCRSFAILEKGSLLAKGDVEGLRKGAGVRFRAALRLGEGAAPPKGFRLRDGLWQKEIGSEQEMPKIISEAAVGGQLYEALLIRPTLGEIYNAYRNGGIQKAGGFDEQDDGYQDDEYQEQDGGQQAAPGSGSPETDDSPILQPAGEQDQPGDSPAEEGEG